MVKWVKQYYLSSKVAIIAFLALAFVLYGNTIPHTYALDDAIVITQNQFTQQGLSGVGDIFTHESFTGFFGKDKKLVEGARYRPLSIATFAIEQHFFDRNPSISHFINVLLYALTGFFLFLVFKRLIPEGNSSLSIVPILTSVFFMFHPVHTEVVANIKGRDEILALLFSLSSCYLVLTNIAIPKLFPIISASVLFLLGLFSKENAIVFLILLPIMLYCCGLKNVKKLIKITSGFIFAALVYLTVRYMVIGGTLVTENNELLNNSFLHATNAQKYATIFYVFAKYLQLLIFPHPLTFDYYPYHISLTDWSNLISITGLALFLGVVACILYYLRKNTLLVFSLFLYLLPLLLVLNLFFPIGTFMNERFLYFSSVGFCLLISIGIAVLINRGKVSKTVVFAFLGIVLLFFGGKTIARNQVWKNDYTLFTHDVKISANSAKSNCSAGGILLESADTINDSERKKAIILQSVQYLKKAVAIHPMYFDAWILLGNAWFAQINSDSAFYCYKTLLDLNKDYDMALKNSIALANNEKNIDKKIGIYEQLLTYQPINYTINYQLGNIYGKEKGNLDKAIEYLVKATAINPSIKDPVIDLGVAYGMKRDFVRSAEMLEKALTIDSTDANIYMNLGITYQNLGDVAKAEKYFEQYKIRKQN